MSSKLENSEVAADEQRLTKPSPRVVIVLAMATAIAPFATDMYLSGLPGMARQFGVSTSVIQLTLTGFLLGVGVGQLVIGPLSDRIGRRVPLLVGSAVCVLASAGCALAPSPELLIGARFIQGFAGAAGAVLSRAVITDRTTGANTARYFSMMMVIGGTAPVVAPILGTAVLNPLGWRGVFWVVTGIAVLIFAGLLTSVPESLPAGQRHRGGLAEFAVHSRGVLDNRAFVGYAVTFAFAFMTLFAWISASPFVLQDLLGLSRGWYAVAFAANAGSMLTSNAINVRLVGRFGQRRMVAIGLSALSVVTVGFGIDVTLGTSRWPTLMLAVCLMACMGLIMGNCAALAIDQVRHAAGTGSAVLGAAQFGLGALIAPLVGVAGNHSATPLAISLLVTTAIAVIGFRTLAGHRS